eukprot:CAMPEP_0203956492 /NCGR_PEP_ID=MMETSP0359-20131031/88736_1 /ASSEMBLY_ACC=CAM_ASM_000338 /TAXON_ID=268821 /ORGANISM="Scrippsiella Hangoei, Strain SHTV-5" /LENGTH=66 /DNA_ID=CAMNT_0050890235 /DNA_START=178 /DNA_END=374 /DNA_ORIENTATION=+
MGRNNLQLREGPTAVLDPRLRHGLRAHTRLVPPGLQLLDADRRCSAHRRGIVDERRDLFALVAPLL